MLRDVAGSYRLAIQETVNHFINWRPSLENIDTLKEEGCWNNDWKATQELIKRRIQANDLSSTSPSLQDVEQIFSGFYFGGEPSGDSREWKGFIRNEPLLVNQDFFKQLTLNGFHWGFISGAEPPSANFVLRTRLGLENPPLIAMGEAPDKPDPTGFIRLATQMIKGPLGHKVPPIAYIGDTVADVLTVQQARKVFPDQNFISLAIAPPHLHSHKNQAFRLSYEKKLKKAGADKILKKTSDILKIVINWETFLKEDK